MSRKPLHDPLEEAQRREDLARLVEDVGRLPEQQRSALLMREIDGMSYADLAAALEVTVPAVKSLLVRARVGLVEAQEARDADCCEIRDDLLASYDRGVKASGRARRHMRSCPGCTEYRAALRGMRRSFAALTPVSAGIGTLAANLLGLGGGGAAVGGSAAAGGAGSAAVGGTLATATACKVAAVVCTAALTAGGAVEVNKKLHGTDRGAGPPAAASAAAAPAGDAAAPITATAVGVPEQPLMRRTMSAPPPAATAPRERARKERRERRRAAAERAPAAAAPVKTQPVAPATPPAATTPSQPVTAPAPSGGVAAPEEEPATAPPAGTEPQTATPPASQAPAAAPQEQPASGAAPPATGEAPGGTSDGSTPPAEH
jgi:hypothetical protein